MSEIAEEFFNDNKEEPQTELLETIKPFQVSALSRKLENIEDNIDNIERTIVGLETTKMYFIEQKNELERQLLSSNYNLESDEPLILNYQLEKIVYLNKNLYILTMPFKLPIYKKIVGKKYDYYKNLNTAYTKPLIEALNKFKFKHQIEKLNDVFVLITHYSPNESILDTDNRFHSFIFNALRGSNLIVDDNHYRMSYMENGYCNADKFYVKVTITEKENYVEAIEYSKI